MTVQGDDVTFTGPDGTKTTANKDDWVGNTVGARPLPGRYWSTNAMLVTTDKQGNLLRAVATGGYANFKSRDDGTIVVSWAADTELSQQTGLGMILPDRIQAKMWPEITALQNQLEQSYKVAKQKAMDDARAGRPYVEPDLTKFTLKDKQTAEVARKYINVQTVLYLQSP